MAPHGLDESSVPYDGHLLWAVQKVRRDRIVAAQVAELARECVERLPLG